MRTPLFLCFFAFLLFGKSTRAGIDKFTKLDVIKSWEIERRIDSETQEVRCRASIPNHYAWFGGRVRMKDDGKLIIPDEFSSEKLPNEETVDLVRKALKVCKRGVIYKIHKKLKD